MEAVFLKLLNLSISAGWLVLAVVVLRWVFKKAPKWMNCLLWGLVGIRLVLPFSLESVLSLVPSAQTVPKGFALSPAPVIDSGVNIINNAINPIISETLTPIPSASINPAQIIASAAAIIWIVGMAVMLLYLLVSYTNLRRRVSTATRLEGNIRQSERVDSPFILGIIKPGIYLPYNMSDEDAANVIAHERAHIMRRDHLVKPLAFLILTVYWFNPLMWLAYILLCRDIELACDEKVIKMMNEDQRRAYSTTLLACNVRGRLIAACPLAFGEVGIKERVVHVKTYKKPAFWIIIAAVIVCVVVAVCFLTNPKARDDVRSPHDWTSSVSASDVNLSSYLVLDEEGLTSSYLNTLDSAQTEELVGILNAIEPETIYTGRGVPNSMTLNVHCAERQYILGYGGGTVELHFDDETAGLYDEGIWEIHDEALNKFMGVLLASETPPHTGLENDGGSLLSDIGDFIMDNIVDPLTSKDFNNSKTSLVFSKTFDDVKGIDVDTLSYGVQVETHKKDNFIVEFYHDGIGTAAEPVVKLDGGVLSSKEPARVDSTQRGHGKIVITVPENSVLPYDLNSVSGSLVLDAQSTSLTIQSVSGSIKVYQPGETLKAESTSGSITATATFKEVSANSISGSVKVKADAETKFVNVTNISGSVNIELDGVSGYTLYYSTISGAVKDEYHGFSSSRGSGNTAWGDENLEITAGSISGSIRLTDWDD